MTEYGAGAVSRFPLASYVNARASASQVSAEPTTASLTAASRLLVLAMV